MGWEPQPVSSVLVYEDRTDLLGHQITTGYEIRQVKPKATKGGLLANVVNHRAERSLVLKFASCGSITGMRGFDYECVGNNI